MIKIGNTIREFKKNFSRVKAEEKGIAKSFARLIRNLRDTKITYERKRIQVQPRRRRLLLTNERMEPAKGIAGAFVRMLDKKPMQFFTDGSLRHVLPGMKPGKALRKALKRLRQRQRAESARRALLVQQPTA